MGGDPSWDMFRIKKKKKRSRHNPDGNIYGVGLAKCAAKEKKGRVKIMI